MKSCSMTLELFDLLSLRVPLFARVASRPFFCLDPAQPIAMVLTKLLRNHELEKARQVRHCKSPQTPAPALNRATAL
jgi:hypothetical protein